VLLLLSAFARNVVAQELVSEAQAAASFERAWQRGTPTIVRGALTVVYADDFTHQRAEVAAIYP
jgi:hypothetical protein